jgi:hypothetical protein
MMKKTLPLIVIFLFLWIFHNRFKKNDVLVYAMYEKFIGVDYIKLFKNNRFEIGRNNNIHFGKYKILADTIVLYYDNNAGGYFPSMMYFNENRIMILDTVKSKKRLILNIVNYPK